MILIGSYTLTSLTGKIHLLFLLVLSLCIINTDSAVLFVGGSQTAKQTEVLLNLEDDFTTIDVTPPFPLAVKWAIGQWFDEKAIVCGGKLADGTVLSDCYSMSLSPGEGEPIQWKTRSELNLGRSGAASAVFGEKLYISGGELADGSITDTIETKEPGQDQQWQESEISLPVPMKHHCMLILDEYHLMVVGGEQEGSSENTGAWILNLNDTTEWDEVADMNYGRVAGACAVINSEAETAPDAVAFMGAKTLEANGGATPTATKNPEHYFWSTDEWKSKPGQVVPVVEQDMVYGVRVSPFKEGRLVLSGGCEKDNSIGITELVEYHWRLGFRPLRARLNATRCGHVSITVPDLGDEEEKVIDADPRYKNLPEVVVVGAKVENDQSSEVVALDGSDPKSSVTEFPLRMAGAASAVLPDGIVVVCGGYNTDTRQHSNICYQLVDSEWTELPTMPRSRSYFTMHAMGDGRLWVLGGSSANGIERGVDVYDPTKDIWLEGVVDMPAGGVAEHCSVKLDDDRVLIAGGRQWEVDQSTNYRQTRIFNTLTLTFGNPVYLNVQRGNLACGLFDLEDGGQVVVAAGGKTPRMEKSYVRFVELFDLKTQTWKMTRHSVCGDLETGCFGQAALEAEPGLETGRRNQIAEAISENTGSKRRLFLLGGTSGVDGLAIKDIYEYHEQFGFFHTESYLDKSRGGATAEFLA